MINQDRLVKRFIDYVQIDSPTNYELDFANHLIKELEKLGFEVEMDDAGGKVGGNSGNLIAKLKGKKEGQAILFSAHMDTVSPGRGIKPIIKDDIIYSDGTTVLGGDDKGGVASILEGIESLLEEKIDHCDIEVIFTVYEEGGLFGAKNLDFTKLNAKNAYVLDSSMKPGGIIVKGPAQTKINAKFIGKKAHAGVAPEEGISAIQIASRAIDRMNLLRIDEDTTANIGLISGGEATNIVPETVEIKGEVRSLDNEKLQKQVDHIVSCCNMAAKDYEAEVEIDVIDSYPALNVCEDKLVVKKAIEAFSNIGIEAKTMKSGGGSDTNIIVLNGIDAVNLGIGMTKVHTTNEQFAIEDLVKSASVVKELIKVYSK